MKIAYINSVAGYGSTGRLIDQLSQMEGIEAKIYFGRKKDLSKGDTFRMTSFAGNVSHALQTFLFDRHAFCNTKETRRMLEDLERFQPDLIHMHNLHGYYIDVQTLFEYLRKKDIPVVWTLHDCWAFTGHCAHYEAVGCEKWKTGCRDCPQLWPYYPTFYGGNVSSNYARKKELFTSLKDRLHLTVPSAWLKEQASMSFLKDTDCRLIANGVDLDVFRPEASSFREEHSLEGKTLVMACSSIWTQRKGLDELIRLSHEMPEGSVLCVVGVSPSQIRKFDPETICVKRTDSVRELAGIYSSADLFVNPTWEESFSLVNVEAQACGCPVVTYKAGGSTEMVSEKTGIVLEKHDIEGMRKAIAAVTGKKIRFNREDCVENASSFSIGRMHEGYRQLYEQLCGGRL